MRWFYNALLAANIRDLEEHKGDMQGDIMHWSAYASAIWSHESKVLSMEQFTSSLRIFWRQDYVSATLVNHVVDIALWLL